MKPAPVSGVTLPTISSTGGENDQDDYGRGGSGADDVDARRPGANAGAGAASDHGGAVGPARQVDDAGAGPQALPDGDARHARKPLGDPPEDGDLHAQADGRHLKPAAGRQAVAPRRILVDARRALAARFQEGGIETAALDARILVEAATGDQRAVDPFSELDAATETRLYGFVARRLAGEPVWRILGEREFWGLPFRLSPATLEPRPDSETIVEAALAALGSRRDDDLAILDLGTGTGCLLIAIASECRQASGQGIDIAAEAVATAEANAALNGVADRVAFRQGDWLGGITGRFDLIVSNPPYIAAGDIAGLDRGVREHDPLRALDGGIDGLDAYRVLARDLGAVLRPGGLVVLEIGAGQEAEVVALMTASGLAHRATRRDLGGHARALTFAKT
jgi:release factor glutamine methyltransferase